MKVSFFSAEKTVFFYLFQEDILTNGKESLKHRFKNSSSFKKAHYIGFVFSARSRTSFPDRSDPRDRQYAVPNAFSHSFVRICMWLAIWIRCRCRSAYFASLYLCYAPAYGCHPYGVRACHIWSCLRNNVYSFT